MHLTKSRTAATIMALFLALTIAATAIALPTANAQQNSSTTNVPTHAFISVAPDPIGVNQPVYIDMWLIEVNPISYANIYGQQVGTGATTTPPGVWVGYTVTIIAPDGTTKKMGPYTSSDISTVDITYTPTQTGNYTATFNFPGEYVNGTSMYGTAVNSYYEPSSATATFTVQQEPITALPQTPLPTSYWTRPINWQNQNWWTIAGNWFGVNQWNTPSGYNPDVTPPTSAHIMWTNPITFGGQIGGSLYNATDLSNYYNGKSYQSPFSPPVIINGVLFYNKPYGIQPNYGTYAVDLRTGQQIWYSNNTNEAPTIITGGATYGSPNSLPGITYGMVAAHHNPNEVGGWAYLWGVGGNHTWSLYDATTGEWILNVVDSPGGTAVDGPEGELLVYTLQDINATTGFLSMWNSTLELGSTYWPLNGWTWYLPTGASLPWSQGIQWNVTVPLYSAPNRYTNTTEMPAISAINDGVILTATGNYRDPMDYQMEVGYSATTGAFLWDVNRSVAQEPGETNSGLMGAVSNGVYTEINKATKQLYGFSMTTGEQLWGPTIPLPYAENSYTRSGGTASDKIWVTHGIQGLYAYDLTTGESVWNFTPPPAGLQTAFPFYPTEDIFPIIAGSGGDQMVFCGTCNSHGDQLFRGAELYGINATNGQVVWSVDGFFLNYGELACADGYLVGFNGYDNQIYCFGKGPSETSVTAPGIGVTTGTSIMITGSVYDISAGSQENAVAANFPTGLPCVSDASESQFMDAVYEQQTMPTNVTGVPVTIDAIDPNGNFVHLGTAITDASGFYSFAVNTNQLGAGPGKYTVIATFAGSNSYYPSYSESAFVVAPAQTATPTTVATQESPMLTYLLAAAIVIIILAVVAIVLLLRRK